MIKLIASDMDGTLLDQNKNLPSDFFNVLDRLKEYNITFVVASGRSYTALKPLFPEYFKNMTFICDNGAFIVKNDKTEYVSGIPHNTLVKILQTCHEKIPDVYPVLCGNNGIYVSEKFKFHSEKELGFYYSSRKVLDNLEDVQDTIFKIALYDENNPKNYSFPVLNNIFGDTMELQISGVLWMDIMNKGINKGIALKNIQKASGISREETMAFGDFYNDIELLKQADYSYVMKNANEDMKAYGRFIAESNDDSGVTKAINEYLDKYLPLQKGECNL